MPASVPSPAASTATSAATAGQAAERRSPSAPQSAPRSVPAQAGSPAVPAPWAPPPPPSDSKAPAASPTAPAPVGPTGRLRLGRRRPRLRHRRRVRRCRPRHRRRRPRARCSPSHRQGTRLAQTQHPRPQTQKPRHRTLRAHKPSANVPADAGNKAKPDSSPGPGCKNSFTADTPVLLADGRTIPIADIRVGYRILASDPYTGKTTARTVTALHINHDIQFVDLTIRSGQRPAAVLRTTAEHPFWNPALSDWVDADELKTGDVLKSGDGRLSEIVAAQATPAPAPCTTSPSLPTTRTM